MTRMPAGIRDLPWQGVMEALPMPDGGGCKNAGRWKWKSGVDRTDKGRQGLREWEKICQDYRFISPLPSNSCVESIVVAGGSGGGAVVKIVSSPHGNIEI